MAESLFDCRDPDHVHIAEMHANWMLVALMEWVLERVENTEGRVSSFLLGFPSLRLTLLLSRWKPFILDWMCGMCLIQTFTPYLRGWRHWSTARKKGSKCWKANSSGFRATKLCAPVSS